MFLGLAALVIAGCSEQGPVNPAMRDESSQETAAADDSTTMLARIDFSDGSYVTFVEGGGVIAASAMANSPDALALRDFGSEIDPPDLYKALSGESDAPIALEMAWSKIAASPQAVGLQDPLLAQDEVYRDDAAFADEESPEKSGSMSGSTFTSTYCSGSGYDWNFCDTYLSGDHVTDMYLARKSYTYVYSYYGHIRVYMRYLMLGIWHDAGSTWLHSGDLTYGHLSTWPACRHEIGVDYASGNTWHRNYRGYH
jgi:hypothetical protein